MRFVTGASMVEVPLSKKSWFSGVYEPKDDSDLLIPGVIGLLGVYNPIIVFFSPMG